MVPTVSFSTGNRNMPTGWILIEVNWLGVSSSEVAGSRAAALTFRDEFARSLFPDSDFKRTVIARRPTMPINPRVIVFFDWLRRFITSPMFLCGRKFIS
jgi:hypothetical protein